MQCRLGPTLLSIVYLLFVLVAVVAGWEGSKSEGEKQGKRKNRLQDVKQRHMTMQTSANGPCLHCSI